MTKNLLTASLLSLALGGCAVYSPTVPSTPLLEKGQVEATVAFRALVATEASLAWSPVPHLLLVGEGAFRGGSSSSSGSGTSTDTLNTHKQVGFGLGSYRISGGKVPLYMAAVAGVGFASVEVTDAPLFGTSSRFEANYTRYYGQFYLAQRGEKITLGASVRGTWVQYNKLLQDQGPVSSHVAHFYLEPTVFGRFGRGPLQGMFTAGLSLPGSSVRADPFRETLAPTSALVSVGLVVRPHLFKMWFGKE